MTHQDLVPTSLQACYLAFLAQLTALSTPTFTACPRCASSHVQRTRAAPLTFRCYECLRYFNPLSATPFNRLQPVAWLARIFLARIYRETYQEIADQLTCDIKKVIRRDQAIKAAMQQYSPALHRWYCAHNALHRPATSHAAPDGVLAQHRAFTQVLTERLTVTSASCRFCQSSNTVKVGRRAAFRCNQCRRGFTLLHDVPIWHLYHTDKWLIYIDLLVERKSNHAIAAQLGVNPRTADQWRRRWCLTMRRWGFISLAQWCRRR